MKISKETKKRKHSKYSASASERWLNCPASVEACETVPPLPDSDASLLGTKAHDKFEAWQKLYRQYHSLKFAPKGLKHDQDMYEAVKKAMLFIKKEWDKHTQTLHTEQRFYLPNIHPEMFGTGDTTIYGGGILKLFDYKHGTGHLVEIMKRDPATGKWVLNSQLMFYFIGAARKFNNDFQKGVIGIIQPRAPHKHGFTRTQVITKKDVKQYTEIFKRGVDRCESSKAEFKEGSWCCFCSYKYQCPLKEKQRTVKAADLFDDDY